jgi:hypothetical protein
MFIIKPGSKENRILALNLLSGYNVDYKGEMHGNQHYIIVYGAQERICEMTFQMNWVQDSRHHGCVKCGFSAPCGHLTFVRPINKPIVWKNKLTWNNIK